MPMKLKTAIKNIEQFSGGYGPSTECANLVLNLLDELTQKYPKTSARLWKKVVKEYREYRDSGK